MEPAARIGTTIDRYRLDALLGTGGFGAVYRARHTHMQRDVALKLMHPDAPPSAMQRLLREARAATAIGSDRIAEVYDCGIVDGQGFIAMELLRGEDLDARIAERGWLSLPEAIEIAFQVAEGLAAAHEAGIVHRDLKPANIFLVDGPEARVKLLDFGVSKIPIDVRLTKTGTVLGTPCYMAPEQLASSKEVDARADVYSLGVVLYQMISGALPFEAPSYEALVIKVVSEPFVPLDEARPGLPRAFVETVERALARDPDARWPSVRAFQAALLAALDAAPIVTQPLERPRPVSDSPRSSAHEHDLRAIDPPRSRRSGWIAVVMLALIAAGALAWALSGAEEDPEPLASRPKLQPPPTQPLEVPLGYGRSEPEAEPEAEADAEAEAEAGGESETVPAPAPVPAPAAFPAPDPESATDSAADGAVRGLVVRFEDEDLPGAPEVSSWIHRAPLRGCQHEHPENVFLRFTHTAGARISPPTLQQGRTVMNVDTPAARCVIAALRRRPPHDLPTLDHAVTLYLPPR